MNRLTEAGNLVRRGARFSSLSVAIVWGLFAFLAPAAAYDLTGKVVDSSEEPIAGATLWFTHDREVRRSESDAGGRFQFSDVPVGQGELVVRKEGYALGGMEGQILSSMEVSVRLEEPASVRLRVIDRELNPVEGARVRAFRIDDAFQVSIEDLAPHGFPSIRSDADGYLTIGELPKGGYVSFTLSHRRHADATVPAFPVGSELDVPLSDGVKVSGRVTNADGEGVERARVSIYRIREKVQYEFAEVLTDAEGFYTARVPPGPYFVVARHGGYAVPYPRRLQLLGVSGEAVVDLTLPTAIRVAGKTVDQNGDPVPAVQLSIVVHDITFAEVYSDEGGAFALNASAGEGVLKVMSPLRMMTVSLPEIPLKIDPSLLNEDGVWLGEIRFKPLPELVGKIAPRDGARLDKVLVFTVGVDPRLLAVTDEEGIFRIPLEKMPADSKVSLRAEHALRFQRRDFSVNIHKAKPVEIRLRPFDPNLDPAPEWAPNDLSHQVGKPAPELRCAEWFNLPEEMDGKPLTLAALRGKVVVLTLWGGFNKQGAGPERIEELRALHYLFRDVGDVAIVSVHDAGIEPHEVANYVKQYRIEFPVGRDADPFLTFDSYNTNVIPQTVLIDKAGVLRYYHVDGRLLELIKDLRRRD